jgi:beta-phosphoglucomutase
MIRAFLVDLDGTLVDTRHANFVAYQAALAEVGVQIDRAKFDSQAFGRNWRQFLPEFLSEAGVAADPAPIAARKASLYLDAARQVQLNTPLVNLLATRPSGVQIALVTSASAGNVKAIQKAHPVLGELFDGVITGDDVKRHKPDPECYHLAASQLGIAIEDCLVFEDSEIGAAAGRAAGAQVLMVQFQPKPNDT